jgi:hypothetical protein
VLRHDVNDRIELCVRQVILVAAMVGRDQLDALAFVTFATSQRSAVVYRDRTSPSCYSVGVES